MRDEDVEPTGEPTAMLSEENQTPRGTSGLTWLLLGLTVLFLIVSGASLWVLSKERVDAQKAREEASLLSLKSQQLQAALEEEKTRGLRDADAIKVLEADKIRLTAQLSEAQAQLKAKPPPPPVTAHPSPKPLPVKKKTKTSLKKSR